MADEYKFTAPSDDTVPVESPAAGYRFLNFDLNAEVQNVCESAQCSGDQTEDHCGEEVALDTDDEGGNPNEAVNSVNRGSRLIGRFSCRGTIGLLKRQQVSAGCLRRLDNKVVKPVFLHLDSARGDRFNEESNADSSCLYTDKKFKDHRVSTESVVSISTTKKEILNNAKEFQMGMEYLNMVRKSLAADSLDESKLSLHESKSMETGRDANFDYDCEPAGLNYVESPEATESHDKSLEFVDSYRSVSDLGSYKYVETRKTNRMKSPPSSKSKGSHSLARRINLGCTASKSLTFEWVEKQIENVKYAFPRMNKDSISGFEGDKSGYVSVNQESGNVNLQNEVSVLWLNELPGNILNTIKEGGDDMDKMGSISGVRVPCDSLELDKEFDAGLSGDNLEKGEQLRLTQDALDIGPDTQMAAEAMEALVHATPAMVDACSGCQGSDNTPLDSSYTANEKHKHAANHDEALVVWRHKERRSKCVKISTVEDANVSWLTAKQLKNPRPRQTVAQLQVIRNSTTGKLMSGRFSNGRSRGNTRNIKCGGPSEQQEDYGFSGRHGSKGSKKIHCWYDRRSDETTCGIKSDSPTKRRKMISFHGDGRKSGAKELCLNLNPDLSSEVKTGTAKREDNSNIDVADRIPSKLNMWIYPKRKRSCNCAPPRHSIGSINQCSPCKSIENNVKKHPKVNEEASNRVAKLLVYERRHKSSSKKKHAESSSNLASHLYSSINYDEVSDRLQASIESDIAKPSMQCQKLDKGKPSSVAVGNIKSDLLSNADSVTFQVPENSHKSKEPFNRVSRSPLRKELTRLGYTESLPEFLPKDSRRRRAMEKVTILFSQNLDASILKQQRKIVAKLGFSIALCCSDATHFVTDRFVRTRNMLESVALGKPVVTHLWLEGCEQAGYVIDEKNYILRDEKKEKEIGFNMPVSLTRASQHPLLKGRKVLITPNVKPGMDVVKGLVKAVHGQAVEGILNTKAKDKAIADDLLILSCEEDYTICLQFLEKGAPIYDSELLLKGIITQKLEYERYQLFKDFTGRRLQVSAPKEKRQ